MTVKTHEDRVNALRDAMKTKNVDHMTDALVDISAAEAEKMYAKMLEQEDGTILQARGIRQLTNEERTFYNAIIEAQRSGDVKAAITNIDPVLPETVIDNVFDDIEQNHALLSHLDIMRVNARIKVLFTAADTNIAVWGKLTDTITKELAYGFEELDAAQLKLSCYIPVPNAYLDLGPTYLDRLTRTYLYEAMSKGIEKAVVSNLKSSDGPIGMMADLTKGTTATGVTTYTAKTAKAVTEWTPKGLAPVLKELAKSRKGNPRPVIGQGLFLAVNSEDNYAIVQPAVMVQNGLGEWVNRSPYPITIVESEYVPTGKAILGMDNRYILGIGSDRKGTIDTSDDCQFLEDARVYRCKMYGNGQPKDNNSFVLLDISGLKEAQIRVNTGAAATETPEQTG